MKISGKAFPKLFASVFSVVAVLAFFLRLFHPVENIWHDRSFLHSDILKPGDPRLMMIAIDDDTVHKHGFPLPRKIHAQVLDKLTQYGVKTVVFDVLFFENREGDAELAAATKRHGGTIHLFTIEQQENENNYGVLTKVRMPIPALAKAARDLGTPIITQHIDDDGHIRRFSLFNPGVKDPIRKGEHEASLAAVALAHYLGMTVSDLHKRFGIDSPTYVLNYRRPGEWLQHEKEDEKWLTMTPEEKSKVMGIPILDTAYRTISVMDILSGRLTEGQLKALKGSLAIIGSTTVGYYDHYPSPFTSHAPGAEYHLNVMDNVMAGDFLRPVENQWLYLLVFFAAWLPFFLVTFLPSAGAAAAVAASLGLLVLASSQMLARGFVLYPVAPGLTMIASFLVLTVHRVLTEGAEKQMIKAKFGQFVSPEIVEELANNPEKAKLGAQKREMTVFFLDIAHFTTISEKMSAEALMTFLNRYLSAFSEVILDRRGTIDKFIGDCVVAFWNAPLENTNHARDAVLSALQCQVAISELNKNLDPGIPEIPQIRIGINTGFMNVGFTGTERKLAYTVIGDQVNLASRLEGANKFFGSQIMISEPTYQGAKEAVEARYLGRARVVGKDTPVPVYEPLAEKGKLTPEWAKSLPVWEKAIKAFYDKKYDEALAAFGEFLALMPKDGPGELYHNLARDYAALPPEDWDQVFNLTAK